MADLQATAHLGKLFRKGIRTPGQIGNYSDILTRDYQLKQQKKYDDASLALGGDANTIAAEAAAADAAAAEKAEDLATAGLVIGGVGTVGKLIDTDIGKSVVTGAENVLKNLWPKPTTAPAGPGSTAINPAANELGNLGGEGFVPGATGVAGQLTPAQVALQTGAPATVGADLAAAEAALTLAPATAPAFNAALGALGGESFVPGITGQLGANAAAATGGISELGITGASAGGGIGGIAAAALPGLVFGAIYAGMDAIAKANDAPGWNSLQAYYDLLTTGKFGVDAPQPGRNYPVGMTKQIVLNAYKDYLVGHAGIMKPNVQEGEEGTLAVYGDISPEQKAIIDDIMANPQKYPDLANPFTTAQWNIMRPPKKEETNWGD